MPIIIQPLPSHPSPTYDLWIFVWESSIIMSAHTEGGWLSEQKCGHLGRDGGRVEAYNKYQNKLIKYIIKLIEFFLNHGKKHQIFQKKIPLISK